MCGVVGFFGRGEACDRGALEAATSALAHRGPDDSGVWIEGDVGLGHRRLAVMDPEGGLQPVVGCSGRVRAVVNGELYGFERIRAELEGEGHRFGSASDSEVLVHLYEAHGLGCLERLRGEFAFVLYDAAARRLVAARDRFGIKPLVYTTSPGPLWLASEPAALFAAGRPAAWDEAALGFSLTLQYLPHGATLFRDVAALPPGHMLVADDAGLEVRPYWAFEYPREGEVEPVEDAASRVRAALDVAVQDRLRADVPVATLLSGGLDSSAVAALAVASGGVGDAFTVRFEHPEYDESHLAAETAARLGLRHHLVPASARALAESFDEAVISAGGLLVNPHAGAKRLLSQAVREAGFKVVLSGEGADEVFAGYPHLRADRLGGAGQAALADDNPVSRGVLVDAPGQVDLPKVRAALGFVPGLLSTKAALGRRVRGWLSPEAAAEVGKLDCEARLLSPRLLAQLEGRSRLSQALVLTAELSLAGYILPLFDDAQEMAFGLEARLPFLDTHVFEVAKRLPDEQKIRGAEEKHVLREALQADLTPAVKARRKHPFFAPPLLLSPDPAVRARVTERVLGAPALFDRGALEAELRRLEGAAPEARRAAEPALAMVMSVSVLTERWGL